jgi:hypothetical protein
MMMKEADTTPLEMEHEGVPWKTLVIVESTVQLVSPVLNPLPEIETVCPPLPVLNDRVIFGATTVKVVVVGLPPDAPGYPPV